MIENIVDRKEFLKAFEKRFMRFCNNCILDITFSLGNDDVQYSACGRTWKHTFDFSRDIKEIIFDMRENLLPHFPTFVVEKVIKKSLTPDQIKVIMEKEGISFDEAFARRKKIVVRNVFAIEKIMLSKNSFVCYNVKDGKKLMIELKSPILIARKKIMGLDEYQRYKFLESIKKSEKYI